MLADSDFKPAWWLPGPHLQTLYPRFARRQPLVTLRRQRIHLPDGDFVDLDWTEAAGGAEPLPTSPIVLILHGLEGSSASPYAQGMLAAIARHGWQGVVMHFRGCSGEINRLPRSYHSGETGDAAFLIRSLRER
jgi:predicted alpha/beta-fold hydrolase